MFRLTSPSRPPTLITVHPSVIAAILTNHTRRPEESTSPRVIGTLMGTRSESGQEIDVRSCFAVPHSENDDQIAVDMPFQQAMMGMLSKNGAKESIVGWYVPILDRQGESEDVTLTCCRYATHPKINNNSALIQNYFTNETSPFPAVHLTVDTELKEDGSGLGVKGWISTHLGNSPPQAENCVFLPIPVRVKYAESERSARKSLCPISMSWTGADSMFQSTSSPQRTRTRRPQSRLCLPFRRRSPRYPSLSTSLWLTFSRSTLDKPRAMSRLDDTFWRDLAGGQQLAVRTRVVSRPVCKIA